MFDTDQQECLTVVAEYLSKNQKPSLHTKIPLQNNRATLEVLSTCKPVMLYNAKTDVRQNKYLTKVAKETQHSIHSNTTFNCSRKGNWDT